MITKNMFDYQSEARKCGMDKYYNFRKKLHNIYQHDTSYSDLAGSIFEYREHNRNINSVAIKLNDYKIFVTMQDNVDHKEYDNAVENIIKIIRDGLTEASRAAYNNEESEEITSMLNTQPFLDVSYLGNTIEINL